MLYYGDNLDILRDHFESASVDLVYLDPPFNSNSDYNVIFKDESGRNSDAQLLAFEDTWHWGPSTAEHFAYLTNTAMHKGRVPSEVTAVIGALRQGIGTNQMLAYLVEMTVRLVELHRVLKPTGSLWLHCDPTASHYLKVVLDAVFGPKQFLNEVVWKRSYGHGDSRRSIGRSHDVLLLYTRSDKYTLNPFHHEHSEKYLEDFFRFHDERGRYKLENLTSPSPRPNLTYPYKGYPPPAKGWRVNEKRMKELDEDGRLHFPAKAGGRIMKKVYLEELAGQPMTDVWTDIRLLSAHDKERLGYPTQKPEVLLERILEASSNSGDVVLDPFCGCGTALVAAQKLGRKWVGIDVTHLSIAVMRARLRDSFPQLGNVKVIGQPTEVEGARMLAAQSLDGRYEFQYWALSLVDAQPVGGKQKKGADSGIDGIITFTDETGKVQQVLVSVKSGGVNVSQVRDLIGTMKREAAPLGLFVTLDEPSKPMKVEAASAGTYHSAFSRKGQESGADYPSVQILSVRELLDGRKPDLPQLVRPAFAQAEKYVEQVSPGQTELF